MIFGNSFALKFLPLLIPVILALAIYRKKSLKALPFFSTALSRSKKNLRLRLIASDSLFVISLACLIIALSAPQWGTRLVPDLRRGVDLVLAFDLSNSMDVRDIDTDDTGQFGVSRLERGIDLAQRLVSRLKGIRIAIAIGKGRGILAIPLTDDGEAVSSFLYSLETASITGRSTNLQSLVHAALNAFEDSVPSRRIIILFSDGEEHSGSLEQAADLALRGRTELSAVGLGSAEGGTIILASDREPVISALNSELLKDAAARTEGMYLSGTQDDAVNALIEYINVDSAESRLLGYRRESVSHWRAFLSAALLCLFAMKCLSSTVRRDQSKKARVKRAHIAAFILGVFMLSSCESSRGKLLIMEANFLTSQGRYPEAVSSYLKAATYDDAAPYADVGLAFVYFTLEENAAALERYEAALERASNLRGGTSKLLYQIFYNMGIVYFDSGEYLSAHDAFRKALGIDGNRIEAKRNLELSLLALNNENEDTQQAAQAVGSGIATEETGERREENALLQYARIMEQEQGRGKAWTVDSTDDSSHPDY